MVDKQGIVDKKTAHGASPPRLPDLLKVSADPGPWVSQCTSGVWRMIRMDGRGQGRMMPTGVVARSRRRCFRNSKVRCRPVRYSGLGSGAEEADGTALM